ncbi:hypothetical protein OG613_47450 (plasmid) [Streptomyces sp. NBC_00015]|uniref:hypothetical protein n=1 Tax=Streptomyces sp. NBC_00015 TaxID=2903611 RepID=UPI002F91A5FC
MTNNSTNTTPSPYQRQLLIAALQDHAHRRPRHDTRPHAPPTVDPRRADGRLLGTATGYTGLTHFRLTHLGIRTAKKYQRIQLTRTHTIGTVAAYQPDRKRRYQDIVTIQSRPDHDGNVLALSGQHHKLITIALTDLLPAPPAALAPGELTNTWAVMDQRGTWLLIVEGHTHNAARRAAAKTPDAKRRSLRAGGFLYRRLRSSEISRLPTPDCTPSYGQRLAPTTPEAPHHGPPTRAGHDHSPGQGPGGCGPN